MIKNKFPQRLLSTTYHKIIWITLISGHYAVTNINSFGIHIGTNTTLATPLITDANVCLEFWYIMPSTSSNIQVLLYRSNNLITIWNGRGTPHSNWQKLQLSIHSTQPYKVSYLLCLSLNISYLLKCVKRITHTS